MSSHPDWCGDDWDAALADRDQRIAELETQCAAMREALEVEDAHRPWDGEGLRAALATDAGKAMLAKVQQYETDARTWMERATKAERERDEWKQEAEWTDRLRTQALTEMRERCALVADGDVTRDLPANALAGWQVGYSRGRQDAAAAIRALPLEGT